MSGNNTPNITYCVFVMFSTFRYHIRSKLKLKFIFIPAFFSEILQQQVCRRFVDQVLFSLIVV